MIELQGRTVTKKVPSEIGMTILQLAKKHDIDWGHICTRGNCAHCRCYIAEGQQLLSEVNKVEERRLDPEEIEAGYRLGCQATIVAAGPIKALNKTYF